MRPPDNTKLYETPFATLWFDVGGILYIIDKPTPRTLENTKEHLDIIKNLLGNKKVCLIVDLTHVPPQDKASRDYTASIVPELFKASAIITASILSRMIANIFLTLRPLPFPTKFFEDEKEAKQWLQQFLHEDSSIQTKQ